MQANLIYELDHIQPRSKCSSKEYLLQLGINQVDVDFIFQTYNKISNIQLIPQRANRSKLDKNIYTWVSERIEVEDWVSLDNHRNHEDYFRSNLIEAQAINNFHNNMNLSEYFDFYTRRKEKIKSAILQMLEVIN